MKRKICVIGAGRWGKNHVRTLKNLGCLGGVVDSDREALDKILELAPDITTHLSIEAALAADYDGYTVATPAETHFEIAQKLLESGKHILVEKPLALSVRDAETLANLASQNGVNLMVGHLLLFHPAIWKIKELIDSGRIGKLQYIYSNRLNLGTVRTEENILWSFAPHDISIFHHLIGRNPLEVISRGGAFTQSHIHDTTMTVLTYPDNVVGHIFVSWLHPFKEHRLVLVGSRGMLSYTDSAESREIKFYEKGIDWVKGEPIKREGPTETIACEEGMPLTNEMSYFVEHLDGTPIERAGAGEAIEVLKVLETATASLKGDSVLQSAESEPNNNYFIHPTSVIDEDVTIGKGTKVWHFSHVQSGSVIGKNCSIGQNVNVGENVKIGDSVKIQNNVSVYEGVELEDYVFCGPSMVFTNIADPRSKYPQRGSDHYIRTLVKEGASLGANCTILCGNTVGKHSFIGAGTVVTKDVPDYALMVGVPARLAGWVCECGEKLKVEDSDLKCVRCGRTFNFTSEIKTSIKEIKSQPRTG